MITKYGASPQQTSKTASGNPGKYEAPDAKVQVYPADVKGYPTDEKYPKKAPKK